MNTLVPQRRSWLASSPVAGSPVRWAGHTALYAAMVTFAAPVSFTIPSIAQDFVRQGQTLELLFVPLFLLIMLLPATALGTILGGLAGAAQPAFADRVRGRVPLPALIVGQSAVGAALGSATAAGGFLAHVYMGLWPAGNGFEPWWIMLARMALYGGFVGAWAGLVWWLPFTVTTVTGGRALRVTAAATATVPLTSLLLWLLFA